MMTIGYCRLIESTPLRVFDLHLFQFVGQLRRSTFPVRAGAEMGHLRPAAHSNTCKGWWEIDCLVKGLSRSKRKLSCFGKETSSGAGTGGVSLFSLPAPPVRGAGLCCRDAQRDTLITQSIFKCFSWHTSAGEEEARWM